MRTEAVIALGEVFGRGVKPKAAIETLAPTASRRDRAFLMELVYGVLRRRDLLDWHLEGFLKRPSGLGMNTINNLRLAVYQMKYMAVPVWAAVDEAVRTEKALRGRPALVNGVLRNVLRHDALKREISCGDAVACIATLTSHPRWLVERWVRRFGAEEARRLCEKNNEIPHRTIRIDPAAREECLGRLRGEGVDAFATPISPSGLSLRTHLTFAELARILPVPVVVQDEAAQLVTYLLGPREGERILDACAAPGGKATHIAQLCRDRAEIVAVEADERRMALLRENVRALGLTSVRTVLADVHDPGAALDPFCGGVRECFDRILLDAPCSSLGVIRRNPDVRYRHSSGDLARFRQRQIHLLASVSGLLRRGGVIVYAVCSTEPEEGEEVVRDFLQNHPDFSIIDGDLPSLAHLAEPWDGSAVYRTFPHRHDMDGFFAVKIRKAHGSAA